MGFLFRTASPVERHLSAGTISVLLFAVLILLRQIVQPDLDEHIILSNKLMEGNMISHPVFFFLLQLFSGFSGNESALLFAAFLLFSFGLYLKIVLSLELCETISEQKASRLLTLIILLCQLAIGFVFIQESYVKASLSPNFFHNGTLLLSIPPSLFLLNQTFLFYKDGHPERKIRMLTAGILITLIKPSFLFCWIPIVPVFYLITKGTGKKLLAILQVAVVLMFCLIVQSTLLRQSNLEFKLLFRPFTYFGSWRNHLIAMVSPVIFPLATFIPGWKSWSSPKGILLAAMYFQGLLISFCFFDSIRNIISPNMQWQSSIIHYIMLLLSGIILNDLLQRKKYLMAVLPVVALLAQVFSGIDYLRIAFIMRSFYF